MVDGTHRVRPGAVPVLVGTTPIEGSGIMPSLNIGAVRATWRAAVRRLDAWTLRSLNSPAGGGRPRL